MPRHIRGHVYAEKGGSWGIRWPEDGKRPRKGGFRTKTAAREWFNETVAPRLKRRGPSAEATLHEFAAEYLDRWGADVDPRTRETIQQWLQPALDRFGNWTLAELEHAANDISRWRARLPTDGARYRSTRALRQVLAAAVRWRYITSNPAVESGPNRAPRADEVQPLTPDEEAILLEELRDSPRDQAIVIFAIETGLRTSEWPALEGADIDRRDPAVTVRRRYVRGQLKPYPKTERSRRRVVLTPRALDALDLLGPPRIGDAILFPNRWGERLNVENWRCRIFVPALETGGIRRPGLTPYTMRHTFATRALRAGVSIFELSRLMGTSVTMIDRTYGHWAHDSESHLRTLLAARADTTREETG